MSTYTPIANITLSSEQSSVTFSNIPQTYTDLVLVATMSNTGTANQYGFNYRINGDSGTNYSVTYMFGSGTSTVSGRQTNISAAGFAFETNNASQTVVGTLNLMNYSNSNTNKTGISRSSNGLGRVGAFASLWRNTAPITSLTLVAPDLGTYNFTSGSTFNLYGINAANSGQAKATGGDSIYRDASYWYHIFRSSGTFTPKQSLTADYLAVGGGAIGGNGGSSSTGAGGGGGGSSSSSFSLTSNSAYTVTVGAGGTYSAFNGNASSISGPGITTVTAGGGQVERAGRIGGLGGTGTSGNGGTGGNGAVGGGGGTNGQAGNAFSITGTSVTYGGGGGGAGFPGQNQGTGGGGGGGNAGNPAGNGVANTGGGGGGCSADNTNGGLGGSGIVIVRYPV